MARTGAGVTLRVGTTDHTSTTALQRRLVERGHNPGPVDGLYGLRTAAAVAGFQRAAGLVVDGAAGPVTLRALGLLAPPRPIDMRSAPEVENAPATQPTGGPFTPPFPGWITGVDVSEYQGKIDALALVAAGVSFLFARATDGKSSVDARYFETARACDHARLPFAPYGVIEPYGSERAIEQAEHFCRTIKGIRGELPPVCDFELAANLSGLDALRSAALWCDHVEQRTGRRCIVYTAPAFFSLLVRYAGKAGEPFANVLASRPLWIAHYTGAHTKPPIVPAPWSSWSIWQASGDRPRAGKIGSPNYRTVPWSKAIDVDVDFFRGTVDDLRALGTIGG